MPVISTLFISLDGVAEIDPAWHFPYFDENMAAAVGDDYADVDVLVLGRVTYDSFVGAWPAREAAGGEDAPFATALGNTRKVVATRGTQELGWRHVERTDDLLATVAGLRSTQPDAKVLVAGSISVVRQLLDGGLLDELRLLVHPVAARSGERLFADGTPLPLTLLDAQTFPTGVIRLRYAPGQLPGAATYADVTDKVPGAHGSDRTDTAGDAAPQ